MSDCIPSAEWTDDEWLRIMKEFPPDTEVEIGEEAVARWRHENTA